MPFCKVFVNPYYIYIYIYICTHTYLFIYRSTYIYTCTYVENPPDVYSKPQNDAEILWTPGIVGKQLKFSLSLWGFRI